MQQGVWGDWQLKSVGHASVMHRSFIECGGEGKVAAGGCEEDAVNVQHCKRVEVVVRQGRTVGDYSIGTAIGVIDRDIERHAMVTVVTVAGGQPPLNPHCVPFLLGRKGAFLSLEHAKCQPFLLRYSLRQ